MTYKFRVLNDEAAQRLNNIKNETDIKFKEGNIIFNIRHDSSGIDYIVDIIDLENEEYIGGVPLLRSECIYPLEETDDSHYGCQSNSVLIDLRKRDVLNGCLFPEEKETKNVLSEDKLILCPIFRYDEINSEINEPVNIRAMHIVDALYGIIISGDYVTSDDFMNDYDFLVNKFRSAGHIVLKYRKYVPIYESRLVGVNVCSFADTISNPGPDETCVDRCYRTWELFYKGDNGCHKNDPIDFTKLLDKDLGGFETEQYKVGHKNCTSCK